MAEKSAKRKRGYGNGSIYYNENRKRWVGQYKLGTKPDGRPDIKAVYGASEAEVSKKLKAIIVEANRTSYVYVQKSTVGEFLLLWLTTVKRIELKDKSYDRLEDTIEKHVIPYIGSIQINALESSDV